MLKTINLNETKIKVEFNTFVTNIATSKTKE